jgi:hypothetical protein
MPDGGLYHAWKDGAAKVPGFLDDYAFLTNALIDLYESGFDRCYLLGLRAFWGMWFSPTSSLQRAAECGRRGLARLPFEMRP